MIRAAGLPAVALLDNQVNQGPGKAPANCRLPRHASRASGA